METKITAQTGADFDNVIKNADLDKIYETRRKNVYAYLNENNITAVVFEDSESNRDPAVRYLTGHPSDAVLVLTQDGKAFLSPWDENLAAQRAHVDQVIPYTSFGRTPTTAVAELLKDKTGIVEVSPATTHLKFIKYTEDLKGFTVECKNDSAHDYVVELRAVKDEYEIACTRKACFITDQMTEVISQGVQDGKFKTETDVALFIERYLREQGCEKTSFDSLVAGPSRSFAIHAFPGYTNGEWGCHGLSILDYGVSYEGYASDCTITIAKGPLSKEQEELLDLVQKAADECIKLYQPGKPLNGPSLLADKIFAEAGKSMPHSLGHGTGLEIHENPFLRVKSPEDKVFKPGHIVTLEPGLYYPELGGTRLENDVLITDDGNVVLTHSKIFRI